MGSTDHYHYTTEPLDTTKYMCLNYKNIYLCWAAIRIINYSCQCHSIKSTKPLIAIKLIASHNTLYMNNMLFHTTMLCSILKRRLSWEIFYILFQNLPARPVSLLTEWNFLKSCSPQVLPNDTCYLWMGWSGEPLQTNKLYYYMTKTVRGPIRMLYCQSTIL